MIPSINLLPYRGAMRARQRAMFYGHLGLSAVVAAALAGAGYMGLQQMQASQNARNALLTQAVDKLNKQVAQVSDLRKTIASLEAREQAVEDLQNSRNTAARIAQSLTVKTPNGIRLTEVKEQGRRLSILGVTDSQQKVADYLRSLSDDADFLHKPDLVRIKSQSPVGNGYAASGPQPLSFELHVTVGHQDAHAGKDGKTEKGR